jgi:thermostable 8-oxoguanine DNA glycosylase
MPRARPLRALLDEVDPIRVDRYSRYLASIRPRTEDDVLRRWLFAYASIHTSWSNNIRIYKALRDLSWEGDERELARRLLDSRGGLHNARAKSISAFTALYRADPSSYTVPSLYPLSRRDDLSRTLYGIGIAKVSFAFEMIAPASNIICLDRHVLRWLGVPDSYNGNMSTTTYRRLERYFVNACRQLGLGPPIAVRHVLWDIQQGRDDMRYWASVFEDERMPARATTFKTDYCVVPSVFMRNGGYAHVDRGVRAAV